MKVSEIKASDVSNYLRLPEQLDESETSFINSCLNIAKNFIENYTGIPQTSEIEKAETLDSYEDLSIVVLILCQDMYDTRSMYVEKNTVNKTVQTILDMHTRNNLI